MKHAFAMKGTRLDALTRALFVLRLRCRRKIYVSYLIQNINFEIVISDRLLIKLLPAIAFLFLVSIEMFIRHHQYLFSYDEVVTVVRRFRLYFPLLEPEVDLSSRVSFLAD